MKFTNGFWLVREGFNIYNPAEAYEVNIDEKSITVYAPCFNVNHRGQTLKGPVITVRLSSPMPEVIRVQAYHFKGGLEKKPSFKINEESHAKIDISENENEIVLKSGRLNARLSKEQWGIKFFDEDRYLTDSGTKNLGYITSDDGKSYMREQLHLDVDEYVYGLGERFTPFVKNGQVVDIWNADGGTSSEQAYKNIPFYITNKGYGVFVAHPELVSFEVGSENVSRTQFSVSDEYLEYYIINGPTMKDVLDNYTNLTGKPALPPPWSFGLWLSTSFVTDYDEKTVTSFIEGMEERNIPLSVFHFDCFWMREFHWCDFEWDDRVFPDPEGMLKRLKGRGLKISVWINPYISQQSKLFDEAMEKGYLLKRPNGDVWQWDLWQPAMGIVDFTNPGAREWYANHLKRLLDMGVDCFKTDFGERIPTDIVYYDGSDPEKMHNYYTYLYNKTVFDVLKEKRGKDEAIVFARSATAGSQQFPVHWGGDCVASYDSMAESLRGGLSLGLCGFGFWSHDIGGFENTATPDLYKRWAAFGLLSSHSRLHGNVSYRVPWLFDEESVDVLRFFTNLKCSLMPYLFSMACQAQNYGIPMMRPMVLEFEDDPACAYLDKQYMLGDSILVAPIFNETGEVSYYLPKGIWTNLLTGETVEGGCWRKERHGYMSLPLMVKPNSIVGIGNRDDRPDYDYTDEITLHIFQLEDNCIATYTICNMQGEAELEVEAKRSGNLIEIMVEGAEKPYRICLRNINRARVEGASEVIQGEMGLEIVPESKVKRVKVQLL